MPATARSSLPAVASEGRSAATRQRLLEAAGEVFAQRGFREATIREISARARANIAAVNYHFRDKDGLYAAVVEYADACSAKSRLKDVEAAADQPPAERLRVFVHSLMARTCDAGRPAWHGKLMAREMIEPTAVLDDIVDESIRPLREALGAIVRELLGRGADSPTVQRCVFSIVGQCLFYPHCRPVIERLQPALRYSPAQIRQLADHIADFSLAALAELKRQRRGNG